MKFHFGSNDGGPESTVRMYGFEWKGVFSALVLRFDGQSRFAYHEHAFNSVSWLLRGMLAERFRGVSNARYYYPNLLPFVTRRTDFHLVDSIGTSWVLSFRGPWTARWREYIPGVGMRVLRHGREVCGE